MVFPMYSGVPAGEYFVYRVRDQIARCPVEGERVIVATQYFQKNIAEYEGASAAPATSGQKGDRPTDRGQVFRENALHYLDALYGYAMSLTHNRTDAEDLVQETYLRAMSVFERLRPNSNLKSWLFTILRNVYLNQIRGSVGRLWVDIDEPVHGRWEFEDKSSKDPLFLYVAKATEAEVRKAIEKLPDAYREVIVLREFEELSYKQIAQVLDCPSGTVMSRLSRARESLKEMLHHGSLTTNGVAKETGG
jgi:RNA polymerase sigma-70 factor (ECF subfamily)